MAKDGSVAFPNHFVNPKEKDGEKWMYQMVNAIWSEWNVQSINSFQKGAKRYQDNTLYSLGKQSNERYKPLFEIAEDENSSYINLDYSPPAIIPKFRRITNSILAKIDFNVNVEAIDPYAMDDKADYEAEQKANIQFRQMMAELGMDAAILDNGEPDQPMDDEELMIKMEFGYKHNEAIHLEKCVDAVFTHEKIHEKLVVAREAGFNTGAWIMKVSTDPVTGLVQIRNVDPSAFICSPTRDPFFRDIWYAGEAILMTIADIREQAKATGVYLDEQQLAEIARQNSGHHGNPNTFMTTLGNDYPYDSFKVPVFDVEFLSCNRYWWEKRWRRAGIPVIGKVDKPREKSGRKYFKEDRTVVYRAKWIPGTKILFDYGPKSHVAVRRSRNKWETLLSYKVVAPELFNMETSPIIENIIPNVDQITIAWYKLQNVIARARPKGIIIEVGALEDISLGDGGEEAVSMRPIDILDMFNQTGVLLYRRMGFDGTVSNYKPIEELNNGLGTEASEYMAVINEHMAKIKDMIGFNDITDGSTPDPKTLNGVAQMMSEATNNALYHLFMAEKSLVEQVAEDVAIRVHDSIAFMPESPYQAVIAPSAVRTIRETEGRLHREYSVAIEYGVNQLEKQRLQMRTEKAMDAGQITMADAVAVERCRNLKQAEQILAYRIKKNAERNAEMRRQEFMDNARANMEAAQVSEEEKRRTLQMEAEIKAMLIDREKEAKKELLLLEHQLNKGEADLNRDVKLQVEDKRKEGMVEAAKARRTNAPTLV